MPSVASAPHASSTLRAVALMLAATLAFALMGVCTKLSSRYFNSGELVFYRGVIGVVLVGAWLRTNHIGLATSVPWMHAWRSIVGCLALSCWFYAIAHLPLATAMTMNYSSSLWVAASVAAGALLFGRKAQPHAHGTQNWLLLTVLVGFVGVALLLRPSLAAGQQREAAIGVLSGVISALAYLQIVALARRGEPEARVVFYFVLGTVVIGALSMVFMGTAKAAVWLQWRAWIWLLPMGALASVGQYCLTAAYASGHTLLVANLNYMGVVFSALFGAALFEDALPWTAWLGMVLIVATGIAATLLRARQRPQTTPVADEP